MDETCLGTGRVKMAWTNEKIQEWRQCLGYFSAHFVKKTFEASTQDYQGVRHEHGFMPTKSAVVRFTSLTDPMHIIHLNKESFSVDVMEDTHSGKKR